jgi:hypothetical protein
LGGAEAGFVFGGIVEVFAEDESGAAGEVLAALDSEVVAVGAGVGEGALEVGILGSPSPKGSAAEVEGAGDVGPAQAVEGELDCAALGIGEVVVGVDVTKSHVLYKIGRIFFGRIVSGEAG